MLDEFFAAQITAGIGITCDDVTTLFDVPDVGRVGTRLNTIFAQLPSYDNPDFLGMDAALNRLKGYVSHSSRYFKESENAQGHVECIKPNVTLNATSIRSFVLSGLC